MCHENMLINYTVYYFIVITLNSLTKTNAEKII